MTITIAIIAAIVIGATAFGAGWQTREWKAGSDEKERIEQLAKDFKDLANQQNKVAVAFEERLGKLRPIHRTIQNEVQREIVEKAVYRDCVVPADGVRLINRAIDAANSAGQPDGAVRPAPAPTR